jgi:hypothetical protein
LKDPTTAAMSTCLGATTVKKWGIRLNKAKAVQKQLFLKEIVIQRFICYNFFYADEFSKKKAITDNLHNKTVGE